MEHPKNETMQDLELQKEAKQVIHDIMESLSEAVIQSKIDEPIDNAAMSFQFHVEKPIDYQKIHEVLADFVRHIYMTGLKSDWIISDPLAETLTLLDTYYQGASSNGYIPAMIDAVGQEGMGLELVIVKLAQIIKISERQKYINGVFARYLNPSDWHLKCRIVQQLIQQYRHILSESLLECTPEQLVDEIPLLISHIQNSYTVLQEITTIRGKDGNR